MMARVDTHSAPRWRVNGSVQNSQHFADAFSCKQGQAMVAANACHVW
jgi:putative endopeptidase